MSTYMTDLEYYKIKQLEGENTELSKKCTYFENLSAEKEINELKKHNYTLGEKCQAETRVCENWKNLCKERDERICNLMREKEDLLKQLDSLNTAMGRLRERYEEEVVCRRKWAKLAGYRDKRIEELQQQLDILKRKDVVFVDLDSVKLKGMEELWAMLGKMFDVRYGEVQKIFGWASINNIAYHTPDVKEFLKKYETWKSGKEKTEEERKRLAEMRDYLDKFCQEHICLGCPLEAEEFKCGHIDFFKEMIPDKDLQKYYEKAVEEKHSDKEQKRLDYMRDYLHRFCLGRVCCGCPLHT